MIRSQQNFQTTGCSIRCLPWPYSDADFKRIENCLPAGSRNNSMLDEIVVAARFYVAQRWAAERRHEAGLRRRPAPSVEIAAAQRAAQNYLDALSRLSPDAMTTISKTVSDDTVELWVESKIAVDRYKGVLDKVIFKEKSEIRGRPRNRHLDNFLISIERHWLDAGGLNRGGPDFRRACLNFPQCEAQDAEEETIQRRLSALKSGRKRCQGV